MSITKYTDFTPVVGKTTTYKTLIKAVSESIGIQDDAPSLVITTKMDGVQIIRRNAAASLPLKGNKGTVTTSIMTRQGKALPNRKLSDYLEAIMPPGSIGELVVNGEVSQAAALIADENLDPETVPFKLWLFNYHGEGPFYRRMLRLAGRINPRLKSRIEIIPMTVVTLPESEEEFKELLSSEFETRKKSIPRGAKLEGLVITHTLAPFVAGEPGKTNHHAMKYVPLQTREFKLVGIEESTYGKNLKTVPEHLWGKPKGWMGSLKLEHPKEGSKPFGVGTGFSQAERVWFWENRENLLNVQSSYWVEIAFMEYGSRGAPRTPRFRSLRDGPSGENIPTSRD